MGSRIAAHFANAGVPAILLDVDAAAVKRGIDGAIKSKAFYDFTAQSLVQPGTFNDLVDCDWILEAVTENLSVKRELLTRVVCKPGAIISTNTSGIPLAAISEGFPSEFRQLSRYALFQSAPLSSSARTYPRRRYASGRCRFREELRPATSG